MNFSFSDAESLASAALQANGADEDVADCVANALILADADGQASHGLARIPPYVDHLRCGKVNGQVKPSVRMINPSSIEVLANSGFAYPAIRSAIKSLVECCDSQGIVMAAIVCSHHCGVMGHHVEKLAQSGYIGLMFANTPKAMAVTGGKRPILGTNPIAFACPRADGNPPIVVDTSLSTVARGRIQLAAKEGRAVPDSWGLNSAGEPTSDPKEILKGSLSTIGGGKGVALAIMVEILAGAFVRSNFGFQASSFFDMEGDAPNVGQLLICIKASEFNPAFDDQVEALIHELEGESDTRIPGSKRTRSRETAITHGLNYPEYLIDSIEQLTRPQSPL